MKIRRRVPQAAVPTAPFAAVAFLTFLVVVTTGMLAAPGGIGFAFRPDADGAPIPGEGPDTIHVKVLSEDAARIAGVETPRAEWKRALDRALDGRREPIVVLHADPAASYDAVLAMAALVGQDAAGPVAAPRIAMPTRAQVEAYGRRHGRDPFEAGP